MIDAIFIFIVRHPKLAACVRIYMLSSTAGLLARLSGLPWWCAILAGALAVLAAEAGIEVLTGWYLGRVAKQLQEPPASL